MAVGCETWEDAARRVRRRLHENPADHAARIALATTLHSRYVLAGVELLMAADERDENDAEIQSLANQALPHLTTDASHTFTAAKLLYFADKNNREQALSIAARRSKPRPRSRPASRCGLNCRCGRANSTAHGSSMIRPWN